MTGISVGDYRDPEQGLELGELMMAVARVPGVERVRLSSVEVIHVRDSLLRGAGHRAQGVPAPARPDAVRRRRRAARDGPPLHRRRVPGAHRPGPGRRGRARRHQRHHRRDRRLPHRGRGRLRAHPGRRRRRRDHPRARLPLLAAARHGGGRPGRPGRPGGEEAPLPGPARPLGAALAAASLRAAGSARAGAHRQGRRHASARATPPTTRAATCRPAPGRAGRWSTWSAWSCTPTASPAGSGGRRGLSS